MVIGGDKAALADLKAATGYERLERLSRTRIEISPARRGLWPFARSSEDEEIDLILMGSPPMTTSRGCSEGGRRPKARTRFWT